MENIKQNLVILLGVVSFSILLAIPYPVNAHATKHSVYNVKQCKRFVAPWKRKSCRRCVKQRGHHYRPYRMGHRCMVNHHYRKRPRYDRHDEGRRRGDYNRDYNRGDRRYDRRYDR